MATYKGGFSARLLLGGRTYPFNGAFNTSGYWSNQISAKNLGTFGVELQLNSDGGQITGGQGRPG